jgi:hypothetical protein
MRRLFKMLVEIFAPFAWCKGNTNILIAQIYFCNINVKSLTTAIILLIYIKERYKCSNYVN